MTREKWGFSSLLLPSLQLRLRSKLMILLQARISSPKLGGFCHHHPCQEWVMVDYCGLLQCTLPAAAFGNHSEATVGSKCSSVNSNGYVCPLNISAVWALLVLGTIKSADHTFKALPGIWPGCLRNCLSPISAMVGMPWIPFLKECHLVVSGSNFFCSGACPLFLPKS